MRAGMQRTPTVCPGGRRLRAAPYFGRGRRPRGRSAAYRGDAAGEELGTAPVKRSPRERGNPARGALPAARPARWRAGRPSAVGLGRGRSPRSSPSTREACTWRRGAASPQPWRWQARRSPVNTGAPWPTAELAEARVLGIQAKLHRWAIDDPTRRFDDLINLVCDPAFLLVGWRRARGNMGARTAGVDGQTAAYIEWVRGEAAFLAELRADLKARRFAPLPVRERRIPKPGGRKRRRLGIPTVRDRVVQAALKLVL